MGVTELSCWNQVERVTRKIRSKERRIFWPWSSPMKDWVARKRTMGQGHNKLSALHIGLIWIWSFFVRWSLCIAPDISISTAFVCRDISRTDIAIVGKSGDISLQLMPEVIKGFRMREPIAALSIIASLLQLPNKMWWLSPCTMRWRVHIKAQA